MTPAHACAYVKIEGRSDRKEEAWESLEVFQTVRVEFQASQGFTTCSLKLQGQQKDIPLLRNVTIDFNDACLCLPAKHLGCLSQVPEQQRLEEGCLLSHTHRPPPAKALNFAAPFGAWHDFLLASSMLKV